MSSLDAYNPSDPLQTAFLNALGMGETGGTGNYFEGVGGSNLSGLSTDASGFPTWNGLGNSHAAGEYQFQPATWNSIASQYGLNFQNPADQNAGAWYLAEQTYAANNNGASLEQALQSGNYSSIQSSLSKVWTSVTGNASLPQGLAAYLSQTVPGTSSSDTNAAGDVSVNAAGSTLPSSSSSSSSGTSMLGNAANAVSGAASSAVSWATSSFTRVALILVGAVIILVALWQLLSNQGIVPSPSDAVKAVAK